MLREVFQPNGNTDGVLMPGLLTGRIPWHGSVCPKTCNRVLVSLRIFRKIARIEDGTQYIVLNNHPGRYMKISELGLPQDLYTEETSPAGTPTRLIVPEKLISWAEDGGGDAVARLCRTIYERKLATIDAWESDRILQLEDEWKASGNDEDNTTCKYETVKHYHTTREDVARVAEQKRASIRQRMAEHQREIEQLVQEAREYLTACVTQRDEGDMLGYMFGIVILIAAGYALIN
jgi:hypothetical protein